MKWQKIWKWAQAVCTVVVTLGVFMSIVITVGSVERSADFVLALGMSEADMYSANMLVLMAPFCLVPAICGKCWRTMSVNMMVMWMASKTGRRPDESPAVEECNTLIIAGVTVLLTVGTITLAQKLGLTQVIRAVAMVLKGSLVATTFLVSVILLLSLVTDFYLGVTERLDERCES